MMTLDRVLLATVCCALVVVSAAPVHAQVSPTETEARSVFDAGEVAFRDGRYADALVYFKRAYDLSHRPALLFNIGLCHDRLRDDDAAIEAYERYLSEVQTPPNRREVDDRLDALRRARARRAATAQAVRPANVARASEGAGHASNARDTDGHAARDAGSDGPAVYETWWFWTIIGVVVVGGAAGVIVATSGDEPLQSGDVGGVVFTLGSTR